MVRSRAVNSPKITTLATPMSSRRTIQLSGVAAQNPLLLPLAIEVRLSINETIRVLKPLICKMLVPVFLSLFLGPTEMRQLVRSFCLFLVVGYREGSGN